MHDATKDQVVLALVEGLLDMELAAISLVLELRLQIRELEVIEEVLEEVDALEGPVADLEYRADDLALHLLVDKNDVLFIVNNIADLEAYFPNLIPQLVYDILKHLLVLNAVDLGHHDDHRHLEGKGYSEIIQDLLFDYAILFSALQGVDHDQGVVRMHTEALDKRPRVPLTSSDVHEGDDL